MNSPLELVIEPGIVLRQFTLDDVDAIFDLIDRNRPHLSQRGDKTAGKYQNSAAVHESIVNPENPDRLRMGIWSDSMLVGSINLTPETEKSAEVGYYLGQEFQGRGFMTRAVRRMITYAFEERGLQELFARVNESNDPSIGVLNRTGFHCEERKSSGEWVYSLQKS